MNDLTEKTKTPLLVARKIEKYFRLKEKVLHILIDADLDIYRGELLGIIGASGVGKSTLLHILGGLDRPQSGEILFDEKNIYKEKQSYLENYRNQHIGFVFQSFNLLPDFTAFENTLFPSLIASKDIKEAQKNAETLLKRVGLANRLHHKPGELSGGECQRVALARSLVNQPDLLLADEPTGNLDSKTSDSLLELIKELQQEYQQTFIIVTHSQKIAENMDRVLQLDEGKIKPIQNKIIL